MNYRPDRGRRGMSRGEIIFGFAVAAFAGALGVLLLFATVASGADPVHVLVPTVFLFGAWLCFEKAYTRRGEPSDPRCEVDYHLRPMVERWVASGGRGILFDPEGDGAPLDGADAARLAAKIEFNRRYHSGELARLVEEARA